MPPQRGPQLPSQSSEEYQNAIDNRVKQILSADVSKAPADLGQTYSDAQKELFPWYQFLFVSGSKPVNHMRAMIQISPEVLVERMPQTLKELVEVAKTITAILPEDDGYAAN